MSIAEKLQGVIADTFGISQEEALTAEFKVTRQWDSVGHVSLMANVENEFDISLEPDDILDFRSFAVGKEILGRYGLES